MQVPSPAGTPASLSLYHGCLPVFSPAKFAWLCYSQPQSITHNPLSWCAINPSPLPPLPAGTSTPTGSCGASPSSPTLPLHYHRGTPWEERTITTGPGRFPSPSPRAAFETRRPEYTHGETRHRSRPELCAGTPSTAIPENKVEATVSASLLLSALLPRVSLFCFVFSHPAAAHECCAEHVTPMRYCYLLLNEMC